MNNNRQNKFESNKKYFTICVYAIFVILIGAIIIRSLFLWDATRQTISHIFSMLSPFLFGAFIAFILHPLVRWIDEVLFGRFIHMKHNGIRYFLSVLLTYTFILGLIVLFFVFLLPKIWQSLTDLWPSLISGYNKLVDFLKTLDTRYPDFDFSVISSTAEDIGKKIFDFNNIKNAVMGILPVVFTTSVSLIKWIVNVFIALMVSIYLLWDRNLLLKSFRKMCIRDSSFSAAGLPKSACALLTHFSLLIIIQL